MTKPRQVRRLKRRISNTEVAMLFNELNNLDGTRFRSSSVFAPIMEMGIEIPSVPDENETFRKWSISFVQCLKMDRHQDALDAIRVLADKEIAIGYTLRRIFEYVLNDLQIEDARQEVKAFKAARESSINAMKMLIGDVRHLKRLMDREPEINCGGPLGKAEQLRQRKSDALLVASSAISEVKSIYNFEAKGSSLNNHRSVFSVLLNLRLHFLMPPEHDLNRGKYWIEIAAIMTTVATAIYENGWCQATNYRYKHTTLQTRAARATLLQMLKIAQRIKPLAPDLVDKAKSEGLLAVPEELASRLAYRPSPKAKLISECALKLRTEK